MDTHDSHGGSQSTMTLDRTGHPTMVLAGTSWEALDYLHSVLGSGRQVEVVCLAGRSAFPEPEPGIAEVVIVSEEDGSLPEVASAWLAQTSSDWRDRTLVCAMPGGAAPSLPEGVACAELSPDPLELFDVLANHAAAAPPAGDDERMALLGFAESLARSVVVGVEGLTGMEVSRQDLGSGAATHTHCVRLPLWLPTMNRKGMLAISFSEPAASLIAEMMTGEDPAELPREEFDELVDSAIQEVANVAAGVIKSQLHDLGVSSILRFPLADEMVSCEMDQAPVRVQAQCGDGDEAIVAAALWVEDLRILDCTGGELRTGQVLAADARIGGEEVWRGDALVPRHLEQLDGSADQSFSIYEEDLPRRAAD